LHSLLDLTTVPVVDHWSSLSYHSRSGRSLLNQMMQASTLLPHPSLLLHVGLVSLSPPFVTVTETAWFEKIFRTMIEAC
jgi:hypothetical protein